MLGHKTSLNKFKKTEAISNIFSNHNSMTLEINYKKKIGKITNMWKLKNMLLLLSCISRVRLCATPQTAAHQAPRPWHSPGKNTGVGCHFLLQYMKVKSESEVAQPFPILSNPMDYSLPGSSVHGFSRQEYWSGCHCLLVFKSPQLFLKYFLSLFESGAHTFFHSVGAGIHNHIGLTPKHVLFPNPKLVFIN